MEFKPFLAKACTKLKAIVCQSMVLVFKSNRHWCHSGEGRNLENFKLDPKRTRGPRFAGMTNPKRLLAASGSNHF